MSQRDPWLASYRPCAAGKIRLICFPYAGGSAGVFRNWTALLPETILVCPVEFPGRGRRFSEPLARNPELLIGNLLMALQPALGDPYALFGHSLGAALAYEIAQRQTLNGGLPPKHLFVSGQRAPHRPDPKPPLHLLPEDEFLQELRRLGGTPPQVFDDPELLALFIPLLRADFQLGETFSYSPNTPLSCPLSVLGGLRDPEISREDIDSWWRYTTDEFRVRFFDGDHFFLHSHERAVTAAIAEDLNSFT